MAIGLGAEKNHIGSVYSSQLQLLRRRGQLGRHLHSTFPTNFLPSRHLKGHLYHPCGGLVPNLFVSFEQHQVLSDTPYLCLPFVFRSLHAVCGVMHQLTSAISF